MKKLSLTLFLALTCSIVFGQNNSPTQALLISPKMAYSNGNIRINTWFFIKGNDADYAKKECDISGWQKLNPSDIKSDFYDKNRRLEGWFRAKIKLDSAFKDIPIYLNLTTWGAADLYLDGKLIKQYGNTGTNKQPFEEYNPITKIPILTNIQGDQEYVLAIHYVDYLSPFPPHGIKQYLWLDIITPKNVERAAIKANKYPLFVTLWIVGVGIITLLLWILAIQNREEKNLKLIALLVTLLTLIAIGDGITQGSSVTNVISYLNFRILRIIEGLTGVVLPLLIVKIVNRTAPKGLKVLLALVFLAAIAPIFSIFYKALYFFSALTPILICIYYIITSRKTLKGAQWAVVVGLLVSIFWLLMMYFTVIFNLKYGALTFYIMYIYSTGFYFSFPFGLLVYVAMRFKEVINELKRNSEQVIKLSEEKNAILETQNETLEKQVEERTAKLKASQAQLIQKEKLASLGELTAGIAHEIQNPLNFVNNFSELSVDLAQEINAEIQKPALDKDYIQELMGDLSQNQEKINHHGKRAASIVRGMLEHSRASSGEPALTDLNTLCDEYLRLSYQGMLAKNGDGSTVRFNADYELIPDPNLPKIKVVPGDIGRVLLNLINNAFQARSPHRALRIAVSTSHTAHEVVIRVRDNGTGISDAVKAKIFQPFFTTKPTGEGTGLGLSLAYDIITKGHGGTLECESVEGVGTTFVVKLPIH